MEPPKKVIVITGSTRGIGRGLAASFLQRGCRLVISGRTSAGVTEAVIELAKSGWEERVIGVPCDVRQPEQLRALWNQAIERFGQVDIWINNAGIAAPLAKTWQVKPQQMAAIVETNLLGSIYGAKVAINGMLGQGFGALYNMEGMGSSGRKQDGLTIYGTTKAAIRYLTEALIEETADTPLLVGSISPGMVSTDLVIEQFKDQPQLWQESKRVLGIIMDDVETVTPWLAERILENDRHGARIAWLSRRKLVGRFLTAPFKRRRDFDELDSYLVPDPSDGDPETIGGSA